MKSRLDSSTLALALMALAACSCRGKSKLDKSEQQLEPEEQSAPAKRPATEEQPAAPLQARAIVELELGETRACARDGEGKVWCWGESFGEGDAERLIGRRVPELEPAVDLAIDGQRVCAIDEQAVVRCLGERFATLRGSTSLRPDTDARALELVIDHKRCARFDDGKIACEHPLPRFEALVDVVDLEASIHDTCALTKAGAVSCIQGGRLFEGLSGAVELELALGAVCVRYEDGRVSCSGGTLGKGLYWQLLHGQRQKVDILTEVELPGPARMLSLSDEHGCALVEGGRVVCQGSNRWAELGRGDSRSMPGDFAVQTGELTIPGARVVATAEGWSCVADASAVRCWGSPSMGGDRVHDLELGVDSIAAGDHATCANRGDEVLCWGLTTAVSFEARGILEAATPTVAQLGRSKLRAFGRGGFLFDASDELVLARPIGPDGERSSLLGGSSLRPDVEPLTQVHAISQNCMLIGQPSRLRCGEYGSGLDGESEVWMPGLREPTRLAAVYGRACVIHDQGKVACTDHQSTQSSYELPGVSDAVAVFISDDYDCAVTPDGRASCWSRSRTLGRRPGLDGDSLGEAIVLPVEDAVDGVASGHELCVRTREGAVDCFALEPVSGLDPFAPATIGPARRRVEAGASQLVAGISHTCALLEGGTVRCWSDDRRGQLGVRPRHLMLEPTVIELRDESAPSE